ncbi:MAG: hypothetical protein QME58_08330 [Bacteroidota bacterium]|nr:hypothetical protein [Bacteroidota bacterium]
MKKAKKKKYTKRIPVPKKPPKVEVPGKAYSRKTSKKVVNEVLKEEN